LAAARAATEEGGKREKQREKEDTHGMRRREREREAAPKRSAIFSRDRSRSTKGISILNPIGGYAWPFHLFATGPKLVLSSPRGLLLLLSLRLRYLAADIDGRFVMIATI